jgi:predicted  nucleic acid-binding Zn-ribbon protein
VTLVEELAKLRDLQKVDFQVYQREQALKALDSGETLKQEAIVLLKRHDAAVAALHKAEAEQRDRELELKSLEEKKLSVHNKLYSGKVTNPKELDALQKDEGMIGGQIGHVEDVLLEIMEKVEAAREEEATSGKLLAIAKRKWQETVARTKAETERLNGELATLRPERTRLAALLTDRGLLRRYDEIRTHSHGIGLAVTDNGICSACHMTLAPNLIDAMSDGYDVVTCENCGRILTRSGS